MHNLIVKDYNKLPDSNYNKFHNFLHKVKNCKILLLTGTPITDKRYTSLTFTQLQGGIQ